MALYYNALYYNIFKYLYGIQKKSTSTVKRASKQVSSE